MSEPTTIYRGHTIRWSDNGDEWTCYDLSDKVRSSPKLSLIKAAIDRLYLAERKSNAVPCFEITHGGNRVESNIVEYLGAKTDRPWNGTLGKTTHRVAVVAQRYGSERPSRRETELSSLMPANTQAEAAWARYVELNNAALEAKKAADNALSVVPRVSPDDIAALVDLHNRDNGLPAQGTSASGQDPKGLEAKPAGPVAKPCAETPPDLSSRDTNNVG